MSTEADRVTRVTEQACHALAALYADAIASLHPVPARLTAHIAKRLEHTGVAQVAGELAYAALLALRIEQAPDGLDLEVEAKGFHRSQERCALSSVHVMIRRLRDASSPNATVVLDPWTEEAKHDTRYVVDTIELHKGGVARYNPTFCGAGFARLFDTEQEAWAAAGEHKSNRERDLRART